MTVEVRAIVAAKIGFASHQNAVPVLADLEIVNSDTEMLENLSVELSADPSFLDPRKWRIDRLVGGSSVQITDRDVKIRADLLAGFDEAVAGIVTIRILRAEETLVSRDYPVELLGRSEWGGASSMAELLAAFVMPNDAAVDRVLKSASEVLRRAGKKDGIDGYEAKSRSRVWELASAIWSAIVGLRISYALPPASFEAQGQKIRTPSVVLDGRLATCLDMAMLFAAALEQAGLNPLVVLTKGHAFAGVWLQPQEFASLVTEEAAALRKRVDLQELVVFETTLVTQAHAPSFKVAIDEGRRQIADDLDDLFVMAVDVRRSRMRRIRPLGSTSQITPGSRDAAEGSPTDGGLEEAPILPPFDVDVFSEPTTAASRIALWQRKLLDLTIRNRLLNLPEGTKAVKLICPDPAQLEDRLAAGKRIKIVAKPDLGEGGRDGILHHQRTGENLEEEYGKAALERDEVITGLDAKKLDASLVDLYRKAKSDLDEGGANTLYLAVGFLKWQKSEADSKDYRAPLILLPVKLERMSALSGVTMLRHDDEARFNLTLLELLRQDFELTIPSLEAGLPTDQSGIDVTGVWNIVRRAVRDVPGFEVLEDLVVGTFSFAKYLMWKDLSDRTEQLKANAVVSHLIERAAQSFPCGAEFPKPNRLDDEVDPANLFVPLPADSSQLAAIVASARGCDFVLDGPPGTGKSQTIANMIAHNLALGRRVLFVAEKMTALDVVYRRLAEKGLGEFCLELHSSKTSKAEVLKRLERAWDVRDALSAEEWAHEAEQVKYLRNRLNDVVRLLHKRYPNGLTLHQAIGRVVRDWTSDMPGLGWPSNLAHDARALDDMREIAKRLDLNRKSVLELPDVFSVVTQREWSNGWQERIIGAAREVRPALAALIAARDAVLSATRFSLLAEDGEAIAQLHRLSVALLRVSGLDLRFAFAPNALEQIALARTALDNIEAFRKEEVGLSTTFSREAASKLDLEKFDADWAAANKSFWFFASIARRAVAKRLKDEGGTVTHPNPGIDLPILRRLGVHRGALAAAAAGLTGYSQHIGLDSDIDVMRNAIDMAQEIRAAVSAAAVDPETLVDLKRSVATLVVDANELLSPDGRIALSVAELDRRMKEWIDLTMRLDSMLAVEVNGVQTFAQVAALADAVVSSASRLKAWCDWQRARRDAVDAGLASIVRALETGSVREGGSPNLFETAYAKWFATHAIDAEPRLRDLVTAEHTDEIEAYRRLDEKLSALSVRYIRAKVCGLIPDKAEVGRKDGYGVLKHELRKQRAHKPIRQLATEMGEAFTHLAPCMLMSPLSIAQYLPPDQALFDLVIFDEASQIAPWDAIGSIARGRQVVVAGDPRQMPPTNFFNRGASVVDEDVEEDMESILDECLGAGVPSHGLSWHYRSRHESLITFSNHRFYDGNLITFPAAVTRASAVEWRRVNGSYAKGKAQTNQIEAEAVVMEVVRRLTDPAFLESGHTLGVVTLNARQQTLVENLLDIERKKLPEIEPFFSENAIEPVVVKNLETVQGDERDVILIGIGFGPTESGAPTMSMNFGPLNRDGGWRRLNVAITRARHEMVIFTSFDPSMIDLTRTNARAVKDLKHFLEFADRGPRAITEAVHGSIGEHESPFEEAVASALLAKNWIVVPQIGVSRFRIDLGVVHPDRSGDYLAGIECDGATYHSAATARDRDKVRAAILTGLGWNLVRIWSTDWWVDKQGSLDRLDRELRSLLERSRAEVVRQQSIARFVQPDLQQRDNKIEIMVEKTEEDEVVPTTRLTEVFARSPEVFACPSSLIYVTADLSAFANLLDASGFYESRYDDVLRSIVAHVLSVEAPISLDVLINVVARAHGFQRSGRLIRDRVMAFVARYHHVVVDPSGTCFAWFSSQDVASWHSFRIPNVEEDTRSIEEISFEEIRVAAEFAGRSATVIEIARLLGTKRLSATARQRIELAVKDGFAKT